MIKEYGVKRGFGAKRTKEYFVGLADGDTLSSIIAGPFATIEQTYTAIDALRPLYFGRLVPIGGHLVSYKYCCV